ERLSFRPIQPLLERIDGIRDAAGAIEVVAELHAHGVPVLFDAYAAPDSSEVSRTILWIDRGALGMVSRDDYLKADDKASALRAKYREHLARIFSIVSPKGDGGIEADRVLEFETALAKGALSPVEERDPDAQHHPLDVPALERRYPAIAWRPFFEA